MKPDLFSKLITLSTAVKTSFNLVHKKLIGELRIGGMSGYLGKYATCALESEEIGHNADGHRRKMQFEENVNSLKLKIDRLGTGKNPFYLDDEDHHWTDFISHFIKIRPQLISLFREEQSQIETLPAENSEVRKFNDAFASYKEFERESMNTMLQACDVIIEANQVSYSVNNGICPSPEILGEYKTTIEQIQRPKRSPSPISNLGALLSDKTQSNNLPK